MALGTALAIGASVAGSALAAGSAKKGAKKAAQAQQDATQQNNALQREIYGQNQQALSPFMQRGNVAGNYLNAFMGLPEQGGVTADAANDAFGNYIQNSDYGFQFGNGANALNSGYAGNGTLQSGAAMKGLEQYRQNLQSGYRNEFTGLLGQQQAVGAGSASALAGVGQNFANASNANTQSGADAASNAALIRGQNNPFANALGALGGTFLGRG